MPIRRLYALWGFLLGLGAPLGSLALRLPAAWQGDLLSALAQEWQQGMYYYVYMTLGTTLAFSLFGYALGKRNEALSDLSIKDGLTGIYNHRYLQERLKHEIERSDRYATPLTCLMIDIDDFKQVNDRHGHLFGDEVLRITAQFLEEAVRKTDRVGRYGGEEFLVIMPHTDSTDALPLANRIVQTIGAYPFMSDGTVVRVTLSIGLATYPEPALGVRTQSALLSAADQALYKAKLAGKNQTQVWRP
jgi:diguanylate cyclase (GGDEF)-like protein